MSDRAYEFVSVVAPAMLTGIFAALACGLLGNFLVLRRLSLMGDAISHAVLPGLVGAFVLTATRSPMAMLAGALVSGLITVAIVEALERFARVERGAAMGVAFSIMFALGVLMLEQAAARHVDLDADCVLYGQLETVIWIPPPSWSALLDPGVLFGHEPGLPRQLLTTAITALLVIGFIAVLFKELRLVSFDPALATALGFSAGTVTAALMTLVAVAAVVSFEAVGSILVIAMLICPAATARLLTDRLGIQILLSGLFALLTSAGGFLLALASPHWAGVSLSAAGMMSVTAGAGLALAIIAAPRYGVVARQVHRLMARLTTAREDLLAALYRQHEQHRDTNHEPAQPAERALDHRAGWLARWARWLARRRGEMTIEHDSPALTPHGQTIAREIVRSHRLWESYLVDAGGLRPDHVHEPAELLEHLRTPDADRRLVPESSATRDPHNRPIPPVSTDPPVTQQ